MESEFTFSKESEKYTITASVGLVSPYYDLNSYLMVRNKRGWDIPGGHVEKGETPDEAFKREVMEETGHKLYINLPVIMLESSVDPTTGIMVYRGVSKEEKVFIPNKEILEVKVMDKESVLNYYFGNKELIERIFALCKPRFF